MTEPQGQARKGFWERTEKPIGVIGAAVGLFLGIAAFFGLPETVQKALGRTESKTAALELTQKRAEVAAAGPRLDVSYVSLSSYIMSEPPRKAKKRARTEEAVTLLSYPSIRNEIQTGSSREPKGCRVGRSPETSVTYLVVENSGNRAASDIDVRLDRLSLAGPVRIQETPVGGDDYVAKLRARTKSAAPLTISIPRTLQRGDGVLVPIWVSVRVPLWMTATRPRAADRWCVVSPTALLPRTVTFVDPVLGSSVTANVRRLRNPVTLGEGVEGRG